LYERLIVTVRFSGSGAEGYLADLHSVVKLAQGEGVVQANDGSYWMTTEKDKYAEKETGKPWR
jgi:hypothetical protein